MTKRGSTGRNEIGMLSDIKDVAEEVGREVLGYGIEWIVETSVKTTGKRPDVEVRRQDGARELLISGEAKRPETPEGIHCFVASEVIDAISKAKSLGGRYAFTTNFLDIAIFDASVHVSDDYLEALVGEDAIGWLDEAAAAAESWWADLTKTRRAALVRPGLERFFAQLKSALATDTTSTSINRDEVYFSIFKQSADSLIAGSVPAMLDAFATASLPVEVLQEAKQRDFDLGKPDVVRYFVAQAVAEVLTSGLFYQTVRPLFSLKPLLRGTRPSSSALLVDVLTKQFAEATKVTGNYETIFQLSAGAKWVLGIDNPPLREQWINLFDALASVKFEAVTSEIVGVIFERLISAERRQDMGQHYTQSRLARAMTAWSILTEDDQIVDFCAGGGTFLVEAYTRLRRTKPHEEVLRQVFGNDLDSFAVHLSTVNLATRDVYKGHNFPAICNRDAFDIRPRDSAVDVVPLSGSPYHVGFPDEFDAVVGNPPYDEKADRPSAYRVDLQQLTTSGGVSIVPTGLRDDINLAGWFILLAAAWLKPSGRIALVLPTAILQNEKHVVLLHWLRVKYDISVWHTESDVWFSDARVSPLTLFMSPRSSLSKAFGAYEFIEVREPIAGSITEVDGLPRPTESCVIRDLGGLSPEVDSLIEGTKPEILGYFEAAPKVRSLHDMPTVSIFRGNKLGHPLYRLKEVDPKAKGVTRLLTGFDIQVRLNEKYLTPLLRSPKDEPSGEFDPGRTAWWILSAPPKLPVGGELQRYMRAVERTGAHEAPSVKQKGATWWSVDWKTSQIAIAAHPQFQHQTWWGRDPFVATDNEPVQVP